MTREEIKQRAEDVLISVGLNRGGDAEIYTILENHIGMAVRATLEEAARALCPDCRHGFPELRKIQDVKGWVHGDFLLCRAEKVHDLIAALDKGVPGE